MTNHSDGNHRDGNRPGGEQSSTRAWKRDPHLILAPVFLVVVLLVLAVIGAWFFAGVSTPEIAVPGLVGMPYAEATAELQKSGFTIEIIPQNGPDTAIGTVLRMSPPPGSIVKPGRSIILYVAAGEALVSVPNLIGSALIEAENLLKRAGISERLEGLTLGVKTSVASDSAPGTILEQSPAPGTSVKVGTPVDIKIAVGKGLDVMPNLVGMTLPAGIEVLATMGYSVSKISNYFTTAQSPNTIMNQKPPAGLKLAPETVISVDVATPPQEEFFDTVAEQRPDPAQEEVFPEPNFSTPPAPAP